MATPHPSLHSRWRITSRFPALNASLPYPAIPLIVPQLCAMAAPSTEIAYRGIANSKV
jgi:hypothetical protein